MRVLHVIGGLAPRYGGPSVACLEMASAVAKRGHEVHVMTTNIDGGSRLSVELYRAHNYKGVSVRYFPLSWPARWATSRALGGALAKEIPSFNIVHIHSLYLFHSYLAGRLCRKYRVPYLVRPHGTLDPYVYKRKRASKAVLEVLYENKNLRSAAAVHFTADEEWRLAEESVGPLNGVVIPLGVEIRDADALQEPGSFRDYYPQLANRPYLLFLGRINYKKGLDILISAFGVLIRRYPELRLVIAGPDNEAFLNQVMVWIREQEVQASVLIVGMLQGKRKLQAFRDAVAFVLPSYSENFGMAVVEAMACGTPVVISDRVNIARRLNELEAAIVVNCDPTELAAALSRLMEDRTLRDRLSRVGRAAVEAEYSWATVGERLDQLYSRIVCGISSQT